MFPSWDSQDFLLCDKGCKAFSFSICFCLYLFCPECFDVNSEQVVTEGRCYKSTPFKWKTQIKATLKLLLSMPEFSKQSYLHFRFLGAASVAPKRTDTETLFVWSQERGAPSAPADHYSRLQKAARRPSSPASGPSFPAIAADS